MTSPFFVIRQPVISSLAIIDTQSLHWVININELHI